MQLRKKKRKQELIFSTLEEIEVETSTKPIGREAVVTVEKGTEPTPTSISAEPVITVESVSTSDISATVPSISLEFSFVYIPPGTFIMGSPEDEPGRNPDETLHDVTITKAFYLQITPVTQGQWKSLMGINPSSFSNKSDDHPVENISWYDCQKFIQQLNSTGEHIYRLPTEAEWEYACRAGTFGSGAKGEIIELLGGHDANLDAMGWYCGNSGGTTHSVAQKKPNPWGIYDMHGNVLEWCGDWYAEYSVTPQRDPTGPISGPSRVIRGGSWFSNAKNCRSASRFYWTAHSKTELIGFRLVRVPNADHTKFP